MTKEESTILVYKNTLVFLFFWKGSNTLLCERDKLMEGDEWRLSHWPMTILLLIIPRCVIFKALLGTSSAPRPREVGDTQSKVHWNQGLTAGRPDTRWCSRNHLRRLTQHCLRLSVSHVDICIYHFIIPAHLCSKTWLLLLIFTGASCGRNLWLKAWWRINNQQYLISLFVTKLNLSCFLFHGLWDKFEWKIGSHWMIYFLLNSPHFSLSLSLFFVGWILNMCHGFISKLHIMIMI